MKHSKFGLHAEDLMAKEFAFLLKWWISCCDAPIRPGKSINVSIHEIASSKLKRKKPAESDQILILDGSSSMQRSAQRCQLLRNVNVEGAPLGGGAWPPLNHHDSYPAQSPRRSEQHSPRLLIVWWFLLSNTTSSSSGLSENKGTSAAAIFAATFQYLSVKPPTDAANVP